MNLIFFYLRIHSIHKFLLVQYNNININNSDIHRYFIAITMINAKMMNTNHIYPMVLIIGSLFAFLPIILNYHYSTQSDDDNIKDLDIQLKQSYNLHMAFVSSIAVMLPF